MQNELAHAISSYEEPLSTVAPSRESIAAMSRRAGLVVSQADNWNPIELRSLDRFCGWAGLDLPKRIGGGGWKTTEMAELFCRCGREDIELRDLVGAGHARLLSLANTRQFDGLLTAVANGSAYCAIALTEPDAGSDLQGLGANAEPVDGGYRINGVKQHISRINECSHFIVFATVQRGSGPALLTPFLVPRHSIGLQTEMMPSMGMSSASWGRVRLNDVRVPVTARIGGEGQGIALFMQHFTYWRIMMAAVSIGSAQAAIDAAGERMKSRNAFGGPIGRFSHLQQALAQHVARLRMAWLLIEDVAQQIDARTRPVFDAAMAKAEAVEIAIGAVDWAMTVFGAAGYSEETGLEKRYRDLAGMRIADGTTDVLRGQVARSFLGDRLYELSLGRKQSDGFETDVQRRRYW